MSKFLLASQAGQLHGEVKSQDVTISGTYPTALPLEKLTQRKDFVLQNLSGVNIWVGGPDVSQFNGLKIEPDGVFGTQLGRGALYGITASATVSGVRILEIA
jgi:hypothetical protein